ncbi:sulfurtransferase TusA family protein [Bartonella sp. M0176]|nr:sulfurtransferase TusA family protein [Bartonella sp. P0291]MBH9996085.1 sulfurtransferase TusA family protein [Bartonella sp. M0192]MBH9998246.1 sulfurtransferase TusA family protein [Bartonella sp. M0191]MBI0008571.1 sulfurtransferase TusA family protein [Bartonella sp. M0193]MBI0009536.1 sulfurtransferase TusA family protein [Bartonella sp. M0176]MBI0013344.1 sulfurtransferase TusA family protein [Bartonella apihabitans]
MSHRKRKLSGNYLVAEKSFIYDLRGLKCPLVLLKTRKKQSTLPDDMTLVILSDDPLAPLDIANYCRQNNYGFEKSIKNGIHHLIIIPHGKS